MAKKAQLTMAEQANRMRSLIEQLLSISRLESGLDNIQRVPVDVGYLLTLVQDEANAVNENFHHTLSFDIQSDARVMGVEAELRSAITNLVINAIKYTPEGGKIEVCWKNVRNGVAFSVKDNGEGIAPQHLRR
ncbi:ATP-binding protein [Pseudobowmanella zhangzhouensis]